MDVRATRPKRPRREPPPTTPDPIEMAMEAEAGDSSEDSPARRLLIKQVRLVGWQIASERAGVALKMLIGLAGVAATVTLALMAWDAHRAHGLVINAFSVPADLEARGLTGRVVASGMLDDLTAMQAATFSMRTASTYRANTGGDELTVQIPHTGISIGDLRRLMVQWLGHQTVIDGEVYRTPTGVVVQARSSGHAAIAHAGTEANLDALIQAAAEDIYEHTQPFRYATYLTQPNASAAAHEKGMAILRRLAWTGADADRAWAFNQLAVAQRKKGDYRGAVAAAGQSLAVGPQYGMGYSTRGWALHYLGRDEAALADLRSAVAGGEREAKLRGRSGYVAFVIYAQRAGPEQVLGAYTRAADLYDAAEQRGYSEDPDALITRALGHDPQPVRARLLSMGASNLAWTNVEGADPILLEWDRRQVEAAAAYGVGDWAAVAATYQESNAGELPPAVQTRRLTAETPLAAMALARLRRIDEAIAAITPTPLDCYRCVAARGLVASLGGKTAAADHWFAEAVRLGPSLPFAETEWGEALLARGQADAAIAKFKAASVKSPHYADPMEGWAEALTARGDWKAAAAKFEEAAALAPRWGRLHLKWGEALARLGKADEARAKFRAAAGMDLNADDRSELARVQGAK